MELDHIFVFLQPDSAVIRQLTAAGLVETYRRAHSGQGTANLCYCFDNLYLECIHLTNAHEATSPAIRRAGLYERSAWRTQGHCPFGLAWRGASPEDAGIECWDFSPPYLPRGVAIKVAVDSDDTRQPMMFTFPGTQPPSAWPRARQGELQHAAGLGSVVGVRLTLPRDVAPSAALSAMAKQSGLQLEAGSDQHYALTLSIADQSGQNLTTLSLPDCTMTRAAHA